MMGEKREYEGVASLVGEYDFPGVYVPSPGRNGKNALYLETSWLNSELGKRIRITIEVLD